MEKQPVDTGADGESRLSQGPFFVSVTVIIGCLLGGVALAFVKGVPAVLVAVVLACGIATLTYTLLGGVSGAGFNLGPISLAGGGAVLIGSAFFINHHLDPQLSRQFRFDFSRHAKPSQGWFALSGATGDPLKVDFTDPVTDEVHTVTPPSEATLHLKLVADEQNNRYKVLGTGDSTGPPVGLMTQSEIVTAVRSLPWQPRFYGLQSLYLTEGEGRERRWGNTRCRGTSMPFEIEVVRFQGFTDIDLRRCDAPENAEADHHLQLENRAAELVRLTIENEQRTFLIAVVAADHQANPPWSRFVVFEIQRRSAS